MQGTFPVESPDTPVPDVRPDAVRAHRAPQTWVGGPVGVRERSPWFSRRVGRPRLWTPSRPKGR